MDWWFWIKCALYIQTTMALALIVALCAWLGVRTTMIGTWRTIRFAWRNKLYLCLTAALASFTCLWLSLRNLRNLPARFCNIARLPAYVIWFYASRLCKRRLPLVTQLTFPHAIWRADLQSNMWQNVTLLVSVYFNERAAQYVLETRGAIVDIDKGQNASLLLPAVHTINLDANAPENFNRALCRICRVGTPELEQALKLLETHMAQGLFERWQPIPLPRPLQKMIQEYEFSVGLPTT